MPGQILRKDLLTERMKLADMVTEMAGDEKEMFLDFASCMLQWLPEKRKTAKELLGHPLLEELHKSHQEYSRSIVVLVWWKHVYRKRPRARTRPERYDSKKRI
uniref:Protein kinase domain-containing protein n=1 Tax=Bionectria ochroleuca TaxID=29856 RepID=A0A8H7K547_BIOOC